MTSRSVSLISLPQPSEVFCSHDVATWIYYLASKRHMHGARPDVPIGFAKAANALLSFAGFHELSEMLQPCLFAGGFSLFANGTDYTVIFVFGLPGPGFARVCCASKDFPTRARTPMKHWVRGPWCAATAFALQAYNGSRFGEIIADLCSGKAGLWKFVCACYALYQFAPATHIYPTAIGPPKRLQVLVYSTLLARMS